MRCPNCGAFLDDNKTVCTMCGAAINNNNNNNNNQNLGFNNFNNNTFNQTGGFGSNNSFNNMNSFSSNDTFSGNPNANPSFSTGSVFSSGNANQSMSQRQADYENKFNSYKDMDYKTNIKKEDKDIFDFFSENKTIIKIVSVLALFALLGFIGYKYYQHKLKPVEEKPILLNLYFEVDSSLQQVAGNSNSTLIYNKSGEKGSACSISITYGSSTEGDHVKEFFQTKKTSLDPERDSNTNVVDELKIFTASDSSMTINDTPWYYLNIFYKPSVEQDPTILKYKYLTSTHKGYYYDIELVNNSNDSVCNASLDNFAKSLKFIDEQE